MTANFTLDRFVALMALIIGTAVFALVLVHALWWAPEENAPAPVFAGVSSLPVGDYPAHLAVSSIGVDARVQVVGLSTKGNIGIPSNFTDVAWYRGSAAPGSPGTAVIDGHVDNGLGLAGVFKRLDEIRVGDTIGVTTRSGMTLQFVVYDIQDYPYTDVPVKKLLAPRSDAELALVSCDGGWVQGARTYDHRLIVYAKLSTP